MRAIAAHAALTAAVAVVGLTAGCAAREGAGSPASGSPTLITAVEIEEGQRAGVRDLYELIDRMRPRWLQVRGPRSLRLETTILVYHHNSRLGGIDALRGYPLISVTSIRYLDSAQAGQLPGAGSAHVEGAIVISTTLTPGGG